MDIRIIRSTSELKTTASHDLDIEKDLEQQDKNLTETIKAYEEKKEEDQ